MKKTDKDPKPGKFVAPVPFYTLPMDDSVVKRESMDPVFKMPKPKTQKSVVKMKVLNETMPDPKVEMKTRAIGTDGITLDGFPSSSVLPPLLTAFGLDPLEDISSFFITKVSKFHFDTEMHLKKRYIIYNVDAKPIFFAGENVDCGSDCWRGMQRRYCMYMFSIHGDLLYTIERQRLHCCSRRPPTQEAVAANIYDVSELRLANTRIHLANGEFIGQVRDTSTSCTPRFQIDDENYSNIFKILGRSPGNWCPLLACQNSEFQFQDRHHNIVGNVYKTLILESKTTKKKATCFGADFPQELSPITKALILGAVFDLNITFFHRKFSMDMLVYILTVIWILTLFVVSILLLLWSSKLVII